MTFEMLDAEIQSWCQIDGQAWGDDAYENVDELVGKAQGNSTLMAGQSLVRAGRNDRLWQLSSFTFRLFDNDSQRLAPLFPREIWLKLLLIG
jgi:hypothetical protein